MGDLGHVSQAPPHGPPATSLSYSELPELPDNNTTTTKTRGYGSGSFQEGSYETADSGVKTAGVRQFRLQVTHPGDVSGESLILAIDATQPASQFVILS